MPVVPDIEAFHREQARIAREQYNENISQKDASSLWRSAKTKMRDGAAATLAETKYLTTVAVALEGSAKHLFFLRRLLAPPLSQDQFSLLCPEYSKAKENDARRMAPESAKAVAERILEWRDKDLTRWIDDVRDPTHQEISAAVETLAVLITAQTAATDQRTLAAARQEAAVMEMLADMGWTRKQIPHIEKRGELAVREYMHKARFAAGPAASQEVDIACGLDRSIILALECKVTNDATNSVKRVNDVLKKAKAWQDHWGSFVRTAAMLQGVISYRDVKRLLDANVEVFWSHRLGDFRDWIDNNVTA